MADAVESDEETFEDAMEALEIISTGHGDPPDLIQAIEETTGAVNLFLNNKFSDALCKMKPWADSSIYHALGYGTILYFQAVMTFETKHIETAIELMKRSVAVSNLHRRKVTMTDSLSKMVRGVNYNSYTDVEIHAELCYAESLLQRALLNFVQDENLISFIKGGLKIRTCYQSYKECVQILEQRNWQDENVKKHFESGVRMGVGAFNLLISCLPSKILKLLEFIGFSGSRTIGLKELEKGYKLNGLRAPLCALILLVYHTFITFFIGSGDGDLDYATSIVDDMLQKYPKGVLFLFFSGRLEEVKGNIDEAIVWLRKAVDSQLEWKQFGHLCYWELMWCHCFNRNWVEAAEASAVLIKESYWSKSTYCYQKAVFLCMMGDELTEVQKLELKSLMLKVPKYKQRIAGKSLPMEKYAIKKSERFFAQGNKLVLPAYELLYVWNAFTIVGKNLELLDPILGDLERTERSLEETKETDEFYMDNYCLVQLLKGVVFKYMNSPLQAEQCFKRVWQNDKALKDDLYLAPYALVEQALIHIQYERYNFASQFLETAKNDYKGISLESRLHFKIHAASVQIKAKQRSSSSTTPTSLPAENIADSFSGVGLGDSNSPSSNGSSNNASPVESR